MSKAIPCHGVWNSLISKKKSLPPEKQFPAKFTVLAIRFPATARSCEVLCPTAARPAPFGRYSVGNMGGFREAVSDWFWFFPGNGECTTGDLAPKRGRKQRKSTLTCVSAGITAAATLGNIAMIWIAPRGHRYSSDWVAGGLGFTAIDCI